MSSIMSTHFFFVWSAFDFAQLHSFVVFPISYFLVVSTISTGSSFRVRSSSTHSFASSFSLPTPTLLDVVRLARILLLVYATSFPFKLRSHHLWGSFSLSSHDDDWWVSNLSATWAMSRI